jgi:hypothetical protein
MQADCMLKQQHTVNVAAFTKKKYLGYISEEFPLVTSNRCIRNCSEE